MNKQDIEQRLINFAALIGEIVETMPDTKAANHLAGQLLRSGASPALNYGEAQSGESRRDFTHKIKIVFKKLTESTMCLNIFGRAKLYAANDKINTALVESNELIAIFVKSVETAQKNLKVN